MKILISTGIYPPAIGGPAQYAKNLAQELGNLNQEVKVRTYGWESNLPTGFRHLVHFLKILPTVWWSDAIIVLDTYSVGVPVYLATRIIRRSYVVRIGGDFLWESYVERTRKKVLLREFYDLGKRDWTTKEKIIFWLTKKVLAGANKLVFSTKWQADIWQNPYKTNKSKVFNIENKYQTSVKSNRPNTDQNLNVDRKVYIWAGRKVFLKNIDNLKKAFSVAKENNPFLDLEILSAVSHGDLMNKILASYVVIIPSLSDISPNLALEAVSLGVPVILTKETGVKERLADTVEYIDPLDIENIAQKILFLADDENYSQAVEKVAAFSFSHTYSDIAKEFMELIKS